MRPGIQHYLDSAKDAGLRMGLASSSSMEWVGRYLDQLGISDYFECIRTSDHVKNVKPDPELYNQTLAYLNIAPEEAVAIEDSPNGARAAAAAGMNCVIIPNAITSFLEFDDASSKIECLSQLDFEQATSRSYFSN